MLKVPSKLAISQELPGETLCEMQNRIVRHEVKFEKSTKEKESKHSKELSEKEKEQELNLD